MSSIPGPLPTLDLDHVRSHFPALAEGAEYPQTHLHNAGGSFACQQTISALHRFYTSTKIQPDPNYPAGAEGFRLMNSSRSRWAEALNVPADRVGFGPSTSQNTYVLAQAFRLLLAPGDVVVLTNQDHEANTGCMRFAAEAAGAEVREWQVDPNTGLLDVDSLAPLLDGKVRLVCFPHVSNVAGEVNDAASICAMIKAAGAWSMVDGVAFVPHNIPDVGAMGADVYLFSLYKVYSVHQGLMTFSDSLFHALPHQGHFFKQGTDSVADRFAPAGPDHAQVAAAGAVLDYITDLSLHHGGSSTLRDACTLVNQLWHQHEQTLVAPVLEFLASRNDVRLVGTSVCSDTREPVIAFRPGSSSPFALAKALCAQGLLCGAGHFYAHRLISALGMDPDQGVLRLSLVHYNSPAEVQQLLKVLDQLL